MHIELDDNIHQDGPLGYLVFQQWNDCDYTIFYSEDEAADNAADQGEDWPVYTLYAGKPVDPRMDALAERLHKLATECEMILYDGPGGHRGLPGPVGGDNPPPWDEHVACLENTESVLKDLAASLRVIKQWAEQLSPDWPLIKHYPYPGPFSSTIARLALLTPPLRKS
jgi:hypothetical protein